MRAMGTIMDKQQRQSLACEIASRTESKARSRLTMILATQMAHLLDAIPDGVVIADESGHIQLVNQQIEVLFGYNREALLGQPVEVLMPERFRTVHPIHRAGYASARYVRPMGAGLQLFGLRQDRIEFPVEISLSPIAVAGVPLILSTIRDVTERRLLERRAREAADERLTMLQAVLDDLPVGVYLACGHDAELVLANRLLTDIWGAAWPVGQPMAAFLATSGIHIHDVHGRELKPYQLATLQALRSGQSLRQYQEVIRHADGSSLPVQVNAIVLAPQVFPYLSKVQTQPEDPVPVVLVVQDNVSVLREAERLKDEFVAVAAHELRNPIASLLGYAHMLTQPAIPRDWQQEAAMAVVESSQRLAALTDDLLDAVRLQANRLELRPEPLELAALVRRVVKRTQVTTERHPITVSVPAAPVLVEADAQRVEQVTTNLLSNAIKYSPDGGSIEVEVELSLHTDPDTAVPKASVHTATSTDDVTGVGDAVEWARVTVRDHGMGIPSGQYERIFGRFSRADNARERGISGTGLGLYLCRELIGRQGGHLWFESAEGIGTTFTFDLPHWIEPGYN